MNNIRIERVIEVPMNKIIRDWDVRLNAGAADQPRVDLLSGLYEDKKEIDPIEVTPPDAENFVRLVEGRTRYAALKQNRVKTVRVGVLTEATDAEYIEYAYKCNCSGPKPPGLEDLKVTVGLLIQRGMKEKEILSGTLAQVESRKRLRLACDQVRSNLNKQGVRKAKALLTTLAIADPKERQRIAAEKCGISVQTLRRSLKELPGIKKNTFLNEVKKDLGFVQNRRRTWLHGWIVRVEDRYDEGMPTNQVLEVYNHLIKQIASNLEMMTDARERFEIRVNSGKSTKAARAGA